MHSLLMLQELRDHVIIAGYGRAGQLIGQLLSENLIPFVALDVSNERVAAGKVWFCGAVCLLRCTEQYILHRLWHWTCPTSVWRQAKCAAKLDAPSSFDVPEVAALELPTTRSVHECA